MTRSERLEETKKSKRADADLGPPDPNNVTLRDWFAGQVLAGIIHSDAWDTYPEMADSAYSIADEMLKRRRRK